MHRTDADLRGVTIGIAMAVVAAVATGCGEKITVPVPEGLYGNYDYYLEQTGIDPQARQLLNVRGNLLVLTGGELKKYARNDSVIASLSGFTDAQAFCADDADSLVFVWDAGLRRVAWCSSEELLPRAYADLPEVVSAVAMAACRAGIEQVPGASTFLYLADPDSGVVHRYAYLPEAGLLLTAYSVAPRVRARDSSISRARWLATARTACWSVTGIRSATG